MKSPISFQDMKFDLVDREDVMFGEPFTVSVKVSNDSKEDRTVKLTLTATNVYYTGVPVKAVKSESYDVKTKPESCKLRFVGKILIGKLFLCLINRL